MSEQAATGAPAPGTPGASEAQPGANTEAQVIVAPVAGSIDLAEPAKPAAEAVPAADAPVVQYDPTGDPGLDVALDFVGARGFAPEHPAMLAATKGDFGPLKEALKALGDKAKGWEKHVALAEKSHADEKAKGATKVAADQEAINKVVGGQEEWNKIADWARTNGEPAEKAQINAALKAGGIAAKAMAAYLQANYLKSPGTTVKPAAVVQPGVVPTVTATGPMTAAEYATQTQALRAKMGYKFESSPEYQALQQRRINSARAGH